MAIFSVSLLLVIFVAVVSTNLLRRAISSRRRRLPPGPMSLPIIGNLHMLGKFPHRTLQNMAKKYGPIMMVRLGSVPTVVVSSSRAAELFLKTHDIAFSNRPKNAVSEMMNYGSKGLVFSEYGPYWRNVRKFCTLELLSAAKIATFAETRREEAELVVGEIREAARAGEVVNLSKKVKELMENSMYRTVFGKKRDDRFDLKGIVQEVMELAGAFNLADYIPFLGPLDPQGLIRRLQKTRENGNKMFDTFIDEHIQDANGGNESQNDDFLKVLLTLVNKPSDVHDELSEVIDHSNIKAIIGDMVAASVETSSTSIEWVLSLLIKNPRVMKLVREELKSVIGLDGMINEKDLEKLNYLDMVIKESLRLFPSGPFLLPRQNMDDIEVDGYFIPKKSIILVSVWAIGRDTQIWSHNAEEFIPERFIGTNIDIKGRHFELLPFGSGRRWCPGMHMGMTNIRLVVAQMIHNFDWTLPNGMSPNELDMTEKVGLTGARVVPLLAVPTSRLDALNV